MQEESKRLQNQITSIQSQINSLPDGNFFCCKNGKYYKWYHTDGKNQTIIPKQNRTYAQALAKKRILLMKLDELQQKKDAADVYLNQYSMISENTEQFLVENEEYRKLLVNSWKSIDLQHCEWMNAPYDKNKKYPEGLVYKTISGDFVRSKSEVMIDMILVKYKIPFRYECALQIGELVIYPDFTIRHPKTDEIYYWEHFGQMDKESYAKQAASKLQTYILNKIIPNIQLITTYETKEKPLSVEQVECIIKEHFL